MLLLEPVTSSDLEERSLAGDAAAFGELIREWDHDLRGVVWTVVRSAHATDSVMHSSYEKAFRNIHRFDGTTSLKTWLHTICLRAAIDHARASSGHEDVDGQASPPFSSHAINLVPDSEELDAVFDSLDRVEQLLLMLTAGLGYGFDETATMVGIARSTVASKAGRAREHLRTRGQS